MKIGINLIDLKRNYRGGLNSYVFGLLHNFDKISRKKIIIYCKSDISDELQKLGYSTKVVKINKLYYLIKFFIILFNLENIYKIIENFIYRDIKKDVETNCSIFYCPLTVLKPYNLRIPTVVSMHDIQHFHFPQNFNYLQRKFRDITFNLSVKYCNYFQASTDFIKSDLIKSYKIKKDKIFVINEGVSEIFSSNTKKDNNFLFFPAQLWQHKNHITVLKAIKILRNKYKKNIKIIMVGQKFSAYKNVKYFIDDNKQLDIDYKGIVNFEELLRLYRSCRFVISPAIYESSSLPVLEAAKMNKPIICSDSPSNVEMSKNFKLNLFKKYNPNHLAKLIYSLWENQDKIKYQTIYNQKKIMLLSWSNIASKYLFQFNKIVRQDKNVTILNYTDNYGGASIAMANVYNFFVKDKKIKLHLLRTNNHKLPKDIYIENNYLINKIYFYLKNILIFLILRIFYRQSNLKQSINFFSSKLFKMYSHSPILHINWIHNEMISLDDLLKYKKKLIISCHDGWFISKNFEHFNINKNYNENFFCRITYKKKIELLNKNNVEIIAPSKWLSLKISSHLKNKKKIHVIPNCYNNSIFYNIIKKENLRKKYNYSKFDKIILCGGYDFIKNKYKGYDFAYRLIKELDKKYENIKVIFLGSNEGIKFFEFLKSSNIKSYQFLKQNRLNEIYNLSDIFIFPSAIESFGLQALEVMATGTPVLCFKGHGTEEIVKHKVNGYCAKKMNFKDLIKGANFILEKKLIFDENIIRKKYDGKKISEKFEEIYFS